jgi:CMP-N,N'-diacetyllegionaminic acid synthase
MIHNHWVLAVITARSGSKGIPGKNIKPLGNRPLLQWPISTALNCKYIDDVVLSTDSEEYATIGRQAGAHVDKLRPSALAADTASSVPVVIHTANEWMNNQKTSIPAEQLIVVLLEPTSPFTQPDNLDLALEQLISSKNALAIVSIADTGSAHPSYCTKYLPNGFIEPFRNYEKEGAPRRQDNESVYFFDGSFYISAFTELVRTGTFYHEYTLGFPVAGWQRFEIDTQEDFIIAEAVASHIDQLKLLSAKES